MKKSIQNILRALVIFLFVGMSHFLYSQPPPPPGGDAGGGSGVGGANGSRNGAPIGGGLFILLAMGAAYGGKKLYNARKERLEE